jgi:hypothetical protein
MKMSRFMIIEKDSNDNTEEAADFRHGAHLRIEGVYPVMGGAARYT